MKILVACEYTGRVRDAFTAAGHDATSCDTRPAETPGPHYQGDIRDMLSEQWDMLIGFPPCTHLSGAGAGCWAAKRADGRQPRALAFVLTLYLAPIPRIAIENPVGWLSTAWRKPDQIINPWWFGDPWKKATCLWLKGLPRLRPTEIVRPRGHWVSSGSNYRRDRRLQLSGGGKPARAGDWDKTFPGIAAAMADQWGSLNVTPDP